MVDPTGLMSNPWKCFTSSVKAVAKCGTGFVKATRSFHKYLKECEDEWEECYFAGETEDCPEGEKCKKYEGCSSPVCARIRCAQQPSPWVEVAKETFSKKCVLAIAKAGYHCIK